MSEMEIFEGRSSWGDDADDRKDVSVPSLMRAVGGHGPECECHVCVELAVDEAVLRRHPSRWSR